MDKRIIDTQVHIGPGGIEETKKAMDALGIQKLIIDECWLENMMEWKPNIVLDDHTIRHINPTAQLAAAMYPERFAYVLRVNRKDPEVKAVVRMVKQDPVGVGIRITPGVDPREWQALGQGEYDDLLSYIDACRLPVFIHMPDHPQLISQIAEKFPELTIIVDHCGLFNNAMRAMFQGLLPARSREEQLELYENVLKLAQYPNVYIKWAHYSAMFEEKAFPPSKRLSEILRKTIDAFGADRIMWASDFSVNQSGDTWGELLYSVMGDAHMNAMEKDAILGKNAERILKI